MMEHEGIIEIDSEFGKHLGFTSDIFAGMSYLWKKADVITFSVIGTREQGKGHLSTLMKRCWELGYTIDVPTPSNRMLAILKAKGFKHRSEYDEVMQDTVHLWRKGPGGSNGENESQGTPDSPKGDTPQDGSEAAAGDEVRER